jgi:putative FmdB family regulatory protein
MPMYEYMCPDCGNRFDKYLPLKSYDMEVKCCDCLSVAKKVMRANFHCQEEAWIKEANVAITGDNEEPVTTRKELNERIEKKGLVHVG